MVSSSVHIANTVKFRLAVFIWLIFLMSLKSQSNKFYAVGGSCLFGSNINKASDREFGNTNPVGAELSFQRHRDGGKYWEKAFNYPHTGWTLTWIDHRNKILGSSFSLNRHLNYVYCRRNYFELYLKASQGIMYATETFEYGSIVNERYNNAISQHVNISTQLGLGINIYPVKHLCFNLAATLTHFSNGAISKPNDGLNLMMLQLGLTYKPHDGTSIKFKQPEKSENSKRIKFNMNVAGGIKQLTPENKKKYPLVSLSVYADKKLSRVNALNIGLDVFLNSAVKHDIENSVEYEGADFKRIGISAGHELFIGRLGILTQVGYHIYSPYPAIASFYQKYGLKYYLTDKLYAAFTLRMFKFEISDEIAFGVGLRL